jgi:hypothetical protein
VDIKREKLCVVVCTCYPSDSGKHKTGGSIVQAGLGKKQDPISKITRAKRTEGLAQAVEHLTSKYEALSSNNYTAKKKKSERDVVA